MTADVTASTPATPTVTVSPPPAGHVTAPTRPQATAAAVAYVPVPGPPGPAGADGEPGPEGPAGTPGSLLAGSAPNLEGAAGDYWSAPAARGTGGAIAGTLYCRLIYVVRNCTLDRIAAAVTTAAAGSTLTLGIYNDDGTGKPGTLLVDAGTIDGGSATAQERPITQPLVAGQRYWLVALCAGGAPVVRVDRDDIGTGVIGRHASLANATGTSLVRQGRTRTGLTGTALPASAGATSIGTNILTIAVRLA